MQIYKILKTAYVPPALVYRGSVVTHTGGYGIGSLEGAGTQHGATEDTSDGSETVDE
jgi:hypothetical protein